jgi:hypothetical protein
MIASDKELRTVAVCLLDGPSITRLNRSVTESPARCVGSYTIPRHDQRQSEVNQ